MMTTRREFLQFMAAAGGLSLIPGCATTPAQSLPFHPLRPDREDRLLLAEGFQYEILLRWKQPLNSRGERFGFNNDYLAYLPLDPKNPDDGLMWVNHEYHDPYFCSGWRPGMARTAEQVAQERREVGGSIVHVRRGPEGWRFVADSKYNRRLDAYTPIPLISARPIAGTRTAIGTFAGCAGGVTPWGTVLSCEENYQNFVGEIGSDRILDRYMSWQPFAKLPPEHYGWVVEVELKTGKARKLTALGRFSRECATCRVAPDGRTVVYSGDDAENEHLYKFIAAEPGSLEQGTLYVADTVNGRWLPLSREADPRLAKAFRDQTELLIRTREAAKFVGATPLDRPEDVEVQPQTGEVFVSLTLNSSAKRPYGSLLKIVEENGDPRALRFRAETFIAGGPKAGFSCPDNLAFDKRGNLWMTSDISNMKLGQPAYREFGNNGLYYIPLSGPEAGRALQVASAPNGAEFTGPCFAPDGETLFLSVQHPGEREFDHNPTPSHWPDGNGQEPAPCVVQIRGPALRKLLNS